MKKTYDELVADNKRLNEKVAAAKSLKNLEPKAKQLMDTIQGIKKKGRVDTKTIRVRDWADHYNISLWHKDGRRVGPLHPDNAKATAERFYELGIILVADRPTPEDIAEYKETDEYKEWKAAKDKSRALKEKTKKGSEAEKIATEIAKSLGKSVGEINSMISSMPARAPQHMDPDQGNAKATKK